MSLVLDLKTSVYIMHPFIAFLCSVMFIGLICTILGGIKDLTRTIENKIDNKEGKIDVQKRRF